MEGGGALWRPGGEGKVRNEKWNRDSPNQKIHILSPPPSHFTILTEEGALELRNLVSLPKPSHLSVSLLIQKKMKYYKLKCR